MTVPSGITDWSIPAWAGKPPAVPRRSDCSQVHPRVGGETITIDPSAAIWIGPSPRGRGNLFHIRPSENGMGSIPAWAGKPGADRS